MILFRRAAIVGPPAAIPPEFERAEGDPEEMPVPGLEGMHVKIMHGFLPVHGVEKLLSDALHELREIMRGEPWQWDTRKVADDIERLLDDFADADENGGIL